MSIEIQNLTVYLKNNTQTLTFSGSIKQYVAGITGYNLSYADGESFMVKNCAVELLFNQAPANQLTVTVNVQLSDDRGHSVDTDGSWVTIGVIAITDVDPESLTLQNVSNIPSGGSSAGIPLDGSSPIINVALLSGFHMGYSEGKDRELQTINANVSVSLIGNEDVVQASALMKDGGSDVADIATVDGGVIATFKNNAGLIVQPVLDQQVFNGVVSVNMDVPDGYKLGNTAAALLTGFQASYGGKSGHRVNTLGAGVIGSGGEVGTWAQPGTPTVNGSVVQVPSPHAYMYSLKGTNDDIQDNDESYVNLMIVATLVPA